MPGLRRAALKEQICAWAEEGSPVPGFPALLQHVQALLLSCSTCRATCLRVKAGGGTIGGIHQGSGTISTLMSLCAGAPAEPGLPAAIPAEKEVLRAGPEPCCRSLFYPCNLLIPAVHPFPRRRRRQDGTNQCLSLPNPVFFPVPLIRGLQEEDKDELCMSLSRGPGPSQKSPDHCG